MSAWLAVTRIPSTRIIASNAEKCSRKCGFWEPLILNFARNYKEALVAVLQPEDYAKFPDMQLLRDKHVLVTGKFVHFKGQTEIVLTKPAQVRLVR